MYSTQQAFDAADLWRLGSGVRQIDGMYWVGLAVTFIWGVGQFLPYKLLYVRGISVGDAMFLIYLLQCALRVLMTGRFSIPKGIGPYSALIAVFVVLSLLSVAVNSLNRGVYLWDIVEVFRPLYYLAVVIFISVWVKRFGFGAILKSFLLGILVLGLVNLYFVSSREWTVVLGFVLLENPNSVGNLFGVGMLFVSLLVLDRRYFVSALFIAAFLLLGVLTYSKGTWIMLILGLAACLVAFWQPLGRSSSRTLISSGAFVAIVLILVPLLAVRYYPELEALVRFKLQTTQIGDDAVVGGSLAARWGFLLASLKMVGANPILGVGLSNYEMEYDLLQSYLGSFYWPTDNPHSAFLYVLACLGVPAFITYCALVLYPVVTLAKVVPLIGLKKGVFVALTLLVFVTSGSVVLHLLTQHYFWFFSGIVLGLKQQLNSRLRPSLR